MKGVPFEEFFPGAPSKIGELLKTSSYFFEQAICFFFSGNRRFKTRIIVFIEDLLITVGCGMIFSRFFCHRLMN